MRKIDKTKILSVEYKKWLDKLNRDQMNHPQRGIYHDDVVMNLLYCQKGVCAYTEMALCDHDLLREDKWEKGRYKLKKHEKPQCLGELEHFDPKLKKDKYWEWDNLFVVLEKINRRKGTKEVDEILKPDSPGYNPMVLLEYDEDYHVFYPSPDIEDDILIERIERMITVLQLNFDFVRQERRKFLTKAIELGEMNRPIEIDRFFTAYQMVAAAKEEGG